MLKRLLRWPGEPYAPWWVIAWRLLWFIPYHIALVLLVACAIAAAGPRVGREIWDDARMH